MYLSYEPLASSVILTFIKFLILHACNVSSCKAKRGCLKQSILVMCVPDRVLRPTKNLLCKFFLQLFHKILYYPTTCIKYSLKFVSKNRRTHNTSGIHKCNKKCTADKDPEHSLMIPKLNMLCVSCSQKTTIQPSFIILKRLYYIAILDTDILQSR